MALDALTAVSPVDGRYHRHTTVLAPFFSEAALIQYRVRVEIEYFIALCNFSVPQLANFPKDQFENLRNIYKNFSGDD
ncbi:MAG: adenylosuccinate lyase, partial [Luteibaculaceae bacterium]